MVSRWIEKLGQFTFDIKHRAGKIIPHTDCLSRINTEDDEQTAFVNAIAMDAKQDNTIMVVEVCLSHRQDFVS